MLSCHHLPWLPCCPSPPLSSPGDPSVHSLAWLSPAGPPPVWMARSPAPRPLALPLPLTFCSSTQGKEFPRSILPLWPSPFWGDQSRSEPEWGGRPPSLTLGLSYPHQATLQPHSPTPNTACRPWLPVL